MGWAAETLASGTAVVGGGEETKPGEDSPSPGGLSDLESGSLDVGCWLDGGVVWSSPAAVGKWNIKMFECMCVDTLILTMSICLLLLLLLLLLL